MTPWLLSAWLLACGPADTGAGDTAPPETGRPDSGDDTGPDTGETGDPGFLPVYWNWHFTSGVRDGLLVEATLSGEPSPPTLEVRLYAEAYLPEYDPTYRCEVRFGVAGTPATVDPAQVFGWDLDLVPEDHTCVDLDGDPFALGASFAWSLAVLPLDPVLEAVLDDAGVRTDHVAGADTWLDGASVAAAQGSQTHYTSALAVDEDMVAQAGEIFTTEELMAGPDGWYALRPAWLFDLPAR